MGDRALPKPPAAMIAVTRLVRARSCLVAFLTVFVPTFTHTHAVLRSFTLALPILGIGMCTFIANDLNDIERDAVNHPSRPLPSGELSRHSAAIIYLATLAASLGLVSACVDTSLQYLYFCIAALAIGYNIVVDNLPAIKTAYVSATIVLGITLVCKIIGSTPGPILLSSTFLFILGREILMDVEDMSGDGQTLVKRLAARKSITIGLGLQFLSAVLLLAIARDTLQAAAAATVTALFLVVISGWGHEPRRPTLLKLMQLQMLVGIVFLA